MERAPKGAVIDASVVAKWFIPEEDGEKASRIMEKYGDGDIDLYAPDLLIYEVANALRYRPDVSEGTLIEGVRALLDLQINLIPPSVEVLSRAIEMAKALDLSVYDACYIAIAEILATNLITADMKLCEKCKGTGLALPLKGLGEEWDIP
ncbi:MAG: type II toxin-antitoxin system VapC family toxin [Candidatus Bathyarchaeia archaeon]